MMPHRVAVMMVSLAVYLLLPVPVRAVPVPEQRLSLGVVNGQVRDNQVVEVIRTLPRSELLVLRAEDQSLPGSLVLSEATGTVRDDGQLAVHVRRQAVSAGQEALMTVRLEVDGRAQRIRLLSTSPLILQVPEATRLVTLRVTEPVRLFLPRGAPGNFALDMEITGYPPADEVPASALSPAVPETQAPPAGA